MNSTEAPQEAPAGGPRIIPRSQHTVSRSRISPNALRVLHRLREGGFQAYLVGGCVRDLLLGLEPKDFDVATDALPEDVKRLFRNCRLIGRRFRLAHVFFGRETIEVATFRAASAPSQGEEPLADADPEDGEAPELDSSAEVEAALEASLGDEDEDDVAELAAGSQDLEEAEDTGGAEIADLSGPRGDVDEHLIETVQLPALEMEQGAAGRTAAREAAPLARRSEPLPAEPEGEGSQNAAQAGESSDGDGTPGQQSAASAAVSASDEPSSDADADVFHEQTLVLPGPPQGAAPVAQSPNEVATEADETPGERPNGLAPESQRASSEDAEARGATGERAADHPPAGARDRGRGWGADRDRSRRRERFPREDEDEHERLTDAMGRIIRDNVYGTIDEDVWRRDFTANALYYSIADFSLWDYVGGFEDIAARRLRLIGDPETRYREDPVRMLRAARFEAKLGFTLDEATAEPFQRLKGLLAHVPPARLFDESLKLFLSGHGLRSLEVLRKHGLLEALLPTTSRYLDAHPGGVVEQLLKQGLQNTDERAQSGKPVTPTYLFALLLYGPIAEDIESHPPEQWHELQVILAACDRAIRAAQEFISIPRRFTLGIREMFALQPRLEYPRGRRALRTLEHPRFRAAYDMLLLRAQNGLASTEIAQWWTRIQEVPQEERARMADALASASGGSRAGSAGPNSRRGPRRRRRRRSSAGHSG